MLLMHNLSMGDDPCTKDVWWSAIKAAQGDSTLAGVLAGLLIAAAAALLVGWYEGSDPHTIALFGSGVPALAFSTYLFTVIAGMDFPQKDERNAQKIVDVCSQMWSQWLLAMGLLFIGGAVLVCGLGWALVSYADNLAVRLCQRPVPLIKLVEARRTYFIRLSGWLSLGVISTTIALLIPANVLYVKTISQGFLGSLEAKWYTVFTVFMLGILFISCSTYVAVYRTGTAQRANLRSCAAYPSGRVPAGADDQRKKSFFVLSRVRRSTSPTNRRVTRNKKVVVRAVKEIAVALWVVLAALLAVYMTFTALGKDYLPSLPRVILLVVGLYIVARAAYAVFVGIRNRLAVETDDTSPNLASIGLANAESVERIRIKYSVGKLSVTTRCVVGLAILAAFFDVALTQGAFGTWQISLSLLLGGLCPAGILAGLSYSIPAAEEGGWSEGYRVRTDSLALGGSFPGHI